MKRKQPLEFTIKERPRKKITLVWKSSSEETKDFEDSSTETYLIKDVMKWISSFILQLELQHYLEKKHHQVKTETNTLKDKDMVKDLNMKVYPIYVTDRERKEKAFSWLIETSSRSVISQFFYNTIFTYEYIRDNNGSYKWKLERNIQENEEYSLLAVYKYWLLKQINNN